MAVLLALETFRTMLSGQEVIIHTDHLNNTVLSTVLRNPDKILRMLLKIEGMCKPRWQFTPGVAQGGDGPSRSPPDRDQARDAQEQRTSLPRTLAEAFEIATNARLDGSIVDDADNITQQFRTFVSKNLWEQYPALRSCQRVSSTSAPQSKGSHEAASAAMGVSSGSYEVASATDGTDQSTELADVRKALFLPTMVDLAVGPEEHENFMIRGPNVVLETGGVLQPSHVSGKQCRRRWLVPFVARPQQTQQVLRKMRLALFDSMLEVLRSIRLALLLSIIAQGEGALVAAACLSEDLRRAAYRERHIPDAEQLELEETASSIEYVVLVNPHGYPISSYNVLLRTYAPELASITLSDNVSVLVLVPTSDTTTQVATELGRSIIGALVVETRFDKPAYRKSLGSGKYFEELQKRTVAEPISTTATQTALVCIEGWAGDALWTAEHARFGFIVRAFECSPEGPRGAQLPTGDILRPENL